MQLTFSFSSWHIEASEGILGRQYDNLAHQIVVVGSLPEGYTWDMLVECRGNYNIIPLAANDTGASATLTADQLALSGYYDFQLRGTQSGVIHHTNSTQVFIPDTIVGPGTWPVLPTEFSQAEAAIKELNAHPPVPGENGYWMLWDLDSHAYVQSDLPIPGLTMQIGDTITGEPGTDALVENVGTPTEPKLQFTIPRGDEGKAATIEVGEVTASDPGSEPQVKNSGTENAAVFDFVLPRGQTGPTGPAATIEVESTVTGEPGTQASVENVGTTGAAKLRFTIPRGNTGQNGVTPTLAAGDVETLEPDQPATASVTGEGPAYQINLGIPRGQTGKTGATPALEIGQVETLEPGQPATAEFSGTPEKPVLSLGIPRGEPGQDGVQLNDSAINTTEAWSSKKIVDTLCPAFTVEGNPVTCQPVEGYPLGVKVSFSPRQEGEGDPSPENVRPITGWGSVKVTVSNGAASHDYDITLPETIYGGTVDAVTGVGSKEWNLLGDLYASLPEKIPGTGWFFNGTYIRNDWYSSQGKWFYAQPNSPGYCSHEQYLANGYNDNCLFVLIEPPHMSIILGKELAAKYNNDPREWVEFLKQQSDAKTPVTICYKLNTPEPFQATGNQPIPALAGENTVYTDGNSLAVSGRSDPMTTIQTMQAQITALQDQATQGGTA